MSALFALWLLMPAGCKPNEPASARPQTPPPAGQTSAAMKRIVGKKNMNVLFVSVDTTRADYLECYGHPTSKTPNINKFASEGARFAWCISSAPLTLVSHSTMMTGSYPFVHGARDNGIYKLAPENVTLAEIFKDAGYTTHAEVAAVVLDSKYGLDQGFETYGDVESLNQRNRTAAGVSKEGQMLGATTQPSLKLEKLEPQVERKATDVINCGIKLLQEAAPHPERPFFIFLHCYDPHWPRESPERFMKAFKDDYVAEIAYFDSEFGRLTAEVDRLGLAENTLFVLTSDHGEGRGQHGEYTHSCFLYDTTMHVPLIMRCKGVIPSGQVVDSQVRLVDLAPTILEFVGMESKRTPQMQGASLLPLLADPKLDLHLPCYSETMSPVGLMNYSQQRALRAENWKYILAPSAELYDLARDNLEVRNLCDADSHRAMAMRQQMWDLIHDAPKPPGSRATLQSNTPAAIKQLNALGYLSTTSLGKKLVTGTELDQFEPSGPSPRDHVEEIELWSEAMAACRIGKHDFAEPRLRRLLELQPDGSFAASQLTAVLAALGRNEEAVAMGRRAVALLPESADMRRKLGVLLGMVGQYKEAEECLRRAVKDDPEQALAYLNLGQVLCATERYEEALASMDDAAKRAADNPEVYFQQALVQRLLGRTDRAIEAFNRSLKLDPTSTKAEAMLGIVCQEAGKRDEAITHLIKAADGMPSDTTLHLRLANCYAAKGDQENAGTWLAKIVDVESNNADARCNLGVNLLARGKKEQGIAQLRKAVEIAPEFASAYFHLAAGLEVVGKNDEAIQTYERVLRRWPKHLPTYQAAAGLFLRQGQPRRSIDVLSKGVETFPDNTALANDLAWQLAASADPSLRDGRRAVELARRFSSLRENENAAFLDTLAAAYAEAGRFDEAVAAADRALEMAQEHKQNDLIDAIQARRTLYKNHQPYHEK